MELSRLEADRLAERGDMQVLIRGFVESVRQPETAERYLDVLLKWRRADGRSTAISRTAVVVS